jgi:hypothetical protein
MVADYHVRLDLETATNPTAGSLAAWAASKTPTGFILTLAVAPGTGDSVTYRYTIWR